VATVAVLFTDIEGSTYHLQRLGQVVPDRPISMT
jgi:class 3 adenylate cyclase